MYTNLRKGAGVVELDALEKRCARKGTEGSNPSPSATKKGPDLFGPFFVLMDTNPRAAAVADAYRGFGVAEPGAQEFISSMALAEEAFRPLSLPFRQVIKFVY